MLLPPEETCEIDAWWLNWPVLVLPLEAPKPTPPFGVARVPWALALAMNSGELFCCRSKVFLKSPKELEVGVPLAVSVT